MASEEIITKQSSISTKRPPRSLTSLLLEPKPIKNSIIRFIIMFVLSGAILGTSLPFISSNWAIYLAVVGVAIGVVSFLQLGNIFSSSKRTKNTYLLNKDGLYVTDENKSVTKYTWKQIPNISVYVPEGRFTYHQCLIETTEGSITLDLNQFIEKNIDLKTSAHIAQALILLYGQRVKNLKKKVLGN